jgi:hypothetical protein
MKNDPCPLARARVPKVHRLVLGDHSVVQVSP